MLRHADRASARSSTSCSDRPDRRAAVVSALSPGAWARRRSAAAIPPLRGRRPEDEGGRRGALIDAAPTRRVGAPDGAAPEAPVRQFRRP